MRYKLSWSGLADSAYYKHIAQYCIPSWTNLPGEKYIVHDAADINIPDLNVVQWDGIVDNFSKFMEMNPKKKTWNFWRKMQSQVWAVRNLKECDFLILLDTDVEVFNFDADLFEKELSCFKESNLIWATGESQRGGHDSGFIVFNMSHPKLKKLINHYENIWESGEIFNLEKSYDGHAVESMFSTFPSYKIKNNDYGLGLHIYEIGFVHWGSKEPKQIRAEWQGTGRELVEHKIETIQLKTFKEK